MTVSVSNLFIVNVESKHLKNSLWKSMQSAIPHMKLQIYSDVQMVMNVVAVFAASTLILCTHSSRTNKNAALLGCENKRLYEECGME